MIRTARGLALAFAAVFAFSAGDQEYKNRGDLDALYCDENGDMVAHTPKDPKKLKTPNTLVFTYTPVEDPAVYEKIFKPFTDHLAQCTGKKVVFYQVQSNAAEIEAMRSGRLHVGGFSTGPTAFAVNIAGAVPFAIKGYEKDFQAYNLIVIVKKSSPFQKLADLKGKQFAHSSPSFNSGHMAPMALFAPHRRPRPVEGLQHYLNTDVTSDNDVDLVFNNPGGLRADITCAAYPCLLTYGTMFTVLPFGNQTVVGDMTGAQILELLNQSASLNKGAIQPAGMRYSFYNYRVDLVPDPVITNYKTWSWGAFDPCVIDKTSGTCEPLDLNATYRVATNEFLAPAGQDNFYAFKYMKNITYWGDMLNQVNAWVSATYTNVNPYNGALDGRITRDAGEMAALEEERDQAVRRAQALSALDEERQRLADELSRRADETERALVESRAEGERLTVELEARTAEEARLRAGLSETARERDQLARELAEVTRERDALLEARRALEKVHEALAQVRTRIG